MFKSIVLSSCMAWASICLACDALCYELNPKALSAVIKQCPDKAPKGVSCETLAAIASRINSLADELRDEPQAFGLTIMQLQSAAANDSLSNNTQLELKKRLAIVKWLETPEG